MRQHKQAVTDHGCDLRSTASEVIECASIAAKHPMHCNAAIMRTSQEEKNLTSNEEADEGQNSLSSRLRHGASGLVHLCGQDASCDNLADSHLESSLDEQELTANPATIQHVSAYVHEMRSDEMTQ